MAALVRRDAFLHLYRITTHLSMYRDQLVTITSTMPHRAVRIVGITEEHGLLRTIPERGGGTQQFIDLQPDGNSFDLMSGLIMSKAR